MIGKSICGLSLAALLAVGLAGCNTPPPSDRVVNEKADGSGGGTTPPPPSASGAAVSIDGSDTVEPITSALVEEMGSKGEVSVAGAGTGAGMQKFIKGEIDIADASRPVSTDEDAKLKSAGIDYYEIAIAYDGVAIIANAKSTLDSITKAQLHTIWDKDSKVKNWSDVDPKWPSQPVKLYGPTSAHGTYEFFNEAIHGDKKNSRQDYSQQATYDALVTDVSQDDNSLGYVGWAYAAQNKGVKILKYDGGNGTAAAPDEASIANGTYPLSRPLFMYISKKAYDSKPTVKALIALALDPKKAPGIVKEAQYVPLPDAEYDLGMKLITAGKTGTHFKAGTKYADDINAALK